VSGPGQQALIRFVDQLSRLRQLAGSPSLNELVALSAGYEWPLRRSTISDKLNARSLPEWDFVVSFVSACREHAEKAGITLPADAADLAGWDTVHWRLLQAVDDVHRDRRLAATAQVEISRRASRVPVPPPATPTEPHRPVPRQLPAAIRHFAGRAGELSALTGLLDEGTRVGGTVVISAIAGTAGVGKTALAVYWAHRVADRFPDGQLYVDLRGFDPSGSPVSSAEAVRGFLEALGVPAQQIPASLQAQTGLYRSILAERRVLLVLDNARDVEQIRPVLPGSPDCLVVVTSRNQLTGLAAEGARPIVLDLLSTTEARTLLDRHLGTARTSDHPEAVAEIITLCARLPLALSIVAARAAAYPRFSLADLAGELRRSGGLDAFDGGDSATNVRAVFSWSYRQLDPAAARMFRLLGLHPGPDLSTAAAASLAGVPVRQARALLAALTRAHLVTERAPGRYAFHDLLRAYATELAEDNEHDTDHEHDTHAARDRVLDHYLHTAHTAATILDPLRQPLALDPMRPGVTVEDIADHGQALDWFTAEHRVLMAVINYAAGARLDTQTWQLAWAFADFLDRRGHWYELVSTQTAALHATERLAYRPGLARAHRYLGRVHTRLGHYDEARSHYQHALDAFGELGDRTGQAHTHHSLCVVYERLGRHEDALSHAQQAVDLYRAVGNQAGAAHALNTVGWSYAQLGDHGQALTYCLQAMDLLKELGDRHGQALTWDSLGYAHRHLGHRRQAIACYERALELFRDVGDRYGEAETLIDLGDAYLATGDREPAGDAWRQALDILDAIDESDDSHAERVRAKLEQLATAECDRPGAAGRRQPADRA